MASEGVRVKALDSRPKLIEIDQFYMTMYQTCGTDFLNITVYCGLHGFTNDEKLEAISIMVGISARVD